ncbi:MAG TPA: hypothetical protein VM576_03445 [Xanthomonadaceae bacterium]|nr:hypothetical protein [Xanthomonadaceae bacterium]
MNLAQRLRVAGAAALLAFACGGALAAGLRVPEAERRTPDQTYLTFPEWFLVFSPDEYADQLQARRRASEFPFFGHVAQFWGAYRQVIGATRRHPFNGEYHTMIVVIGVSTTVEYAIKGAYETLVGRLTELAAPGNDTPEDRLAARQAREYVDFVRVRPWYEFDFVAPLRELWRQPAWGPHPLRKWERRYLLTSEWAVKAGYAALLRWGARSTFHAPAPTTWAVVAGLPGAPPEGMRIARRDGDRALAVLPRYQGFTDTSLALARRGARFVEIAGNRGPILVSVVVPANEPVAAGERVLIRQPILTRPGHERRVLELPVAALSAQLARDDARGIAIEHVFDY